MAITTWSRDWRLNEFKPVWRRWHIKALLATHILANKVCKSVCQGSERWDKDKRWRLDKISTLWDEGNVGSGNLYKDPNSLGTDLLAILPRFSVTFSIKFRFYIHNIRGPPVWSRQFPLQNHLLLSRLGLNFTHNVRQTPRPPGIWLA